jgi:glyoxylase I family protein
VTETIRYIGLAHASVLVRDTRAALAFYCDVLGMAHDDARPDLGFPGAWLRIGTQQIHLLELPNPDPVAGRPAHGGRDRHTALYVADIAPVMRALQTARIDFTRSRSGRAAIFCRDPDGNALELIESR